MNKMLEKSMLGRNSLYQQTLLSTILITVICIFSVDIYLPAFPQMAQSLHVQTHHIALTVSAYAVFMAVGQFFAGPLSDKYGRKRIVAWGLGIAAAAMLLSIFTSHYWIFMLARVLQGVGLSVFALTDAMLKDVFDDQQALTMRTYRMTAAGLFMALAPVIGSGVLYLFNWQAIFALVMLLTLAVLAYLICFTQETCTQRQTARLAWHLQAYGHVLRQAQWQKYAGLTALIYCLHFVFITTSAHILLELMHLSLVQYGEFMALYGFIYLLGGVVAIAVSRRMHFIRLLGLGGLLLALSGVGMTASVYTPSLFNAPFLLVCIVVCVFGITLLLPNASTQALAVFSQHIGVAAAALNIARFAIGAGVGVLVNGMLPQHGLLSLALLSVVCGGLCLTDCYQHRREVEDKLC